MDQTLSVEYDTFLPLYPNLKSRRRVIFLAKRSPTQQNTTPCDWDVVGPLVLILDLEVF